MTTTAQVPNRLAKEKSPYLLQHQYNPVDWYPWGPEVFKRAVSEDKPLFLSIGYSTCHWCHVMERESFEDEEVAAVLNAGYISVKVDREERPDLDHLYMTFCQAMTGHGGWPLTIIMTAEKKPFFAGTYLPKESRMGIPGLLELLKKVAELWREDRDKLVQTGDELTEYVARQLFEPQTDRLSAEVLDYAFEELATYFDPVYGGFGSAPKFPSPHNLLFLLSYHRYKAEPQALEMVEKTLEQMYKGGIFDHLGFGFARYSTDQKWLVPHFEKMLYDNALLAIAYLDAYQITGKSLYRDVAEKVFGYVLREMTSPEGTFYSAEDADSEGVEGKYYLWTPAEVEKVLGEEAGTAFCRIYDITEKGNFAGSNIPNLIGKALEKLSRNTNDGGSSHEQCRQKLLAARAKRIPPFKDDKILTGWNALMIAALAIGSRVLEEHAAEYLGLAEKAFAFLRQRMVNAEGRLLARYRDGEAAYPAYLDDYAFLVWALLELYQSTGRAAYLEEALFWNEQLLSLFGVRDKREGTLHLYMTGSDSEDLLLRPWEIYDGALPSGNSVAAWNFLRLADFTGNEMMHKNAEQLFLGVGGNIKVNPMGHTFLLRAYCFLLNRMGAK